MAQKLEKKKGGVRNFVRSILGAQRVELGAQRVEQKTALKSVFKSTGQSFEPRQLAPRRFLL
jgi:hypothetical protein